MGCNCQNCTNKYYHNQNRAMKTCNSYYSQSSCDSNGKSQTFDCHKDIAGISKEIRNDNYYNNYYTRYNHYYIKNYDHITDYYKDVNIYHYSHETVYNGCKYLGSITECDQQPNQPFANFGMNYSGLNTHSNCNNFDNNCNCSNKCNYNSH